jgi:hypothetical protein
MAVEYAARHFVAAGDAAKDVDQHGLDVLVGQDDAQRRRHLVRLGAAADVEEVGRLAAVQLDMSIVAIARPAPLTMQPISPSR